MLMSGLGKVGIPLTELERYDASRAPMMFWPLGSKEEYTANTRGARRHRFDDDYWLKNPAWDRRNRLALLQKTAPWLVVGLGFLAALFVN